MRKLLIPFVTAGYPSRKGCLDLLKACAAGGADQIELGIPFSDPLADGPVIQATSQKALEGGVTTDDAFRLAEGFREAPLLFMTYVNPVLQYNPPRFFSRSSRAGLRGVILADLPPEEADGFLAASRMSGVPLIFLCSPTCTDGRIRKIGKLSGSFVYLVSLKGVTGARMKADVGAFVRRVRRLTDRPLCVGFGVSTPDDARRLAEQADGIIVGTALLRIVERGGKPREVERFVASLRRAIDRPAGGFR
jgi:tryptophan synthase alpha chain